MLIPISRLVACNKIIYLKISHSQFDGLWLRVRVKFHLGVRVSGMIRVTVGVRVMVRVSNLLGSD